LADVQRVDDHTQPLDLVDPGTDDVLWPPVATPQSLGDRLAEGSESVPQALSIGGVLVAYTLERPTCRMVQIVVRGYQRPELRLTPHSAGGGSVPRACAVLRGLAPRPDLLRYRHGRRGGVRRTRVRSTTSSKSGNMPLDFEPRGRAGR
jgi:hypothetical protein